ncbi:MAG: DUF2062 domain-containing protein [Gammaproteobacteria bacterium]
MGLRSFFKHVLPEHHEIRRYKNLQILGDILHDPNIFHLTRHSAAGGVATGLFFAFMPIPGQMLAAAIVAVFFRVNLPLAVILVWVSNPITIPPLFFLAYKTGAMLLNEPTRHIAFEFSFNWFGEKLSEIWQPLLLGCLTYGTIAAVTGYTMVKLLWRLAIVRKWEERKKKGSSAESVG